MKFQCARIFTDHMVLQRNLPVAVFGTGEEGAVITAELLGKTATATVQDGKWLTHLPAMDQRGELTLTVSCGEEKIVFSDVVLGEVWIAAGQSNMEFRLEESLGGGQEAVSYSDDDTRYYRVVKAAVEYERDKIEALTPKTWLHCNKESSWGFSAIAHYFAKELRKSEGVPVGIIACYWGGTPISCWVSEETLASDPAQAVRREGYDKDCAKQSYEEYLLKKGAYEAQLAVYEYYRSHIPCSLVTQEYFWRAAKAALPFPWPPAEGYDTYQRPCGLYNTMVRYAAPFTARGVMWYQGEGDTWPQLYGPMLEMLIADWRKLWGQDDLFFSVVQLPGYEAGGADDDHWGKLRLVQQQAVENTPHAALVVTADVGQKTDIHPIYKKPVGERLAKAAQMHVYHRDVDARLSKPVEKSIENGIVRIAFDMDLLPIPAEIKGFQLCGEDGVWHNADAVLFGSSVQLSSPAVAQPVSARYAMTNWTEPNVYQCNGLPLPPFVC